MEESKPYSGIEEQLSGLWSLMDGLEIEKYVVAVYIAEARAKMDAHAMIEFMAYEQSTGTWVRVPAETDAVRKKHIAKILGVYEIPHYELEIPKEVESRKYCVIVAYPLINMVNSDNKLNFPLFWTNIWGNISMAPNLKLVDFWLPKDALRDFPGPKFGIDGIRDYLKCYGRPMLNNMLKPKTGHTPDVAADMIYKAGVGGTDIIKDDELIADAPFNTIEDRITKGMEAVDRANEEKGEKTIYTINVTDNLDKVFKNIDIVQEHGGNGILINYFVVGFPIVQKIAEDPSIKLVMMGHMDFGGNYYSAPFQGMAGHLALAKVPRLIGCDTIVTPAPYGKAFTISERFQAQLMNQRLPLGHIKPSLPMPSGGITPGMVEACLKDCGIDCLIGSGGGIHAHPDGATAGAKAFRQAIDAAVKGISQKDYAKDHKELAVALGLWGSRRTGI